LPCDNKETEVTQLIIGLKPEMTMRQYGHSAGAKLWRIQRSFAQGAHSTCRQCMTWMLGGASRQTGHMSSSSSAKHTELCGAMLGGAGAGNTSRMGASSCAPAGTEAAGA